MNPVFAQDDVARLRGRWLRIHYSQSFRGQPARPWLRLHRGGGPPDTHILPAAVFGRARWIGPAPPDLVRLELLADVQDDGDIRVDSLEAWPFRRLAAALLARGLPGLVQLARWPLRTGRGRMLGAQGVLDGAPLAEIARFAATRTRPLDPHGIDAALALPGSTGRLCLVLVDDPSDGEGVRATLASLAGADPRSVRLRIGVSDDARGEAVRHLARELGLAEIAEVVPAAAGATPDRQALALAVEAGTDWVALLHSGDRLAPEAVPVLLDALKDPGILLLYTDAVVLDAAGRWMEPELKPDWSPEFLGHRDYVGRLAAIRADALAAALLAVSPDDPHPWWTLARAVGQGRTAREIRHLRRLLLWHRPEATARPGPDGAAPTAALPAGGQGRIASIVIPTRNRADLLRRAVGSIRRWTPPGSYELVIVDNGTDEAEARAYLATLRGEPDVTLLDAPGPFNFSRLVNAGVEAAGCETIVLLNNDCEVLDGVWLAALVALAAKPGIGAVGARLLYANGTLQHAGIGIGQGGFAGHRDRKLPGDHPGHLDRLTVPHEVSAVTAACLAVGRRTYREAGGFDEGFAVAFNDVDFCLRLGAKGYRNLLAPGVMLRHAESASRGHDVGPKRARFLEEASRFAERWRETILSDPYTHPLLAIDRFADRLG